MADVNRSFLSEQFYYWQKPRFPGQSPEVSEDNKTWVRSCMWPECNRKGFTRKDETWTDLGDLTQQWWRFKADSGDRKKLLRVVRCLAGQQTKMPTSALSFLLLFLPVNWTFPHSTTVFPRRNGSQWLKDHNFNSVTQDFSLALPGLNYQERPFKEEYLVTACI